MLLQLHFKHDRSNSVQLSQMSFNQMFCAILFLYIQHAISPNNTSGEMKRFMHRSSEKVGLAYRMRVLTQWHNSYDTCSGFRLRRASALFLKTKELRGMLFHVVAHCKKGEERGRRCVWGRVTHIPLAFWIYNYPRLNGPHNISGP